MVEFLGLQSNVTKKRSLDVPVSEWTTVKDVLQYVRQKYPDLELKDDAIVINVNNEVASLDSAVKPDDVILFLPVIGGG